MIRRVLLASVMVGALLASTGRADAAPIPARVRPVTVPGSDPRTWSPYPSYPIYRVPPVPYWNPYWPPMPYPLPYPNPYYLYPFYYGNPTGISPYDVFIVER